MEGDGDKEMGLVCGSENSQFFLLSMSLVSFLVSRFGGC